MALGQRIGERLGNVSVFVSGGSSGSSTGSSNVNIINYVKGWAYQDFTAGDISGTAVTLTANQNGLSAPFSVSKIIAESAVIVRKTDLESLPYTGTTRLFSSKVEVTTQTADAVTLS
jgi:hypothetical protein